MASEHSLTIQIAPPSSDPFSPGHAAVVINTPTGQTYAGFGPNRADRWLRGAYSHLGQFDVQRVDPGVSPRVGTDANPDYSNVFDHKEYSTFTIPISEAQASAALAETNKLASGHGSYLVPWNVCSTVVDQIMQAAGLGHLFVNPSKALSALNEAVDTLARDPNAEFTPRGMFIPKSWRGLQKDYAFTGRGYDTPSEQSGRFPKGRSQSSDAWQEGASGADHIPYGAPGSIGDGNGIGDWFRNLDFWQQTSLGGPADPMNIAGGKVGGAQSRADVSPFESVHKAVPFASYQSMPYSTTRLSGQAIEDQEMPLAPHQMLPYGAAHVAGDAVQGFPASPSTPQPQGEESAFRFDDLPNGKRTGGAAVSGPAPPNRQTDANLSAFESAHKVMPLASYQGMPYSAARLAGQTFEDQGAPVLRLVQQPQDDHASTTFPQSPMDQASTASSAATSPDNIKNLLKRRAIIQAVGSRGLFPMQ